MLSHGKSYAFTKKGTQKAVFLRPLTIFYALFSPGLHFSLTKFGEPNHQNVLFSVKIATAEKMALICQHRRMTDDVLAADKNKPTLTVRAYPAGTAPSSRHR